VVVVLLAATLLLASILSMVPRAATFTPDAPPHLLPRAGFYGVEQFPDQAGRYRWTKGSARLDLPNPGGTLRLDIALAGGPGRTVPAHLRGNPPLPDVSFTVKPEVQHYRLLLPPAPGERITLWLESPTMPDPRNGQKLGLVVSDITIEGRGLPPVYILVVALLGTFLFYGVMRLTGFGMGWATGVTLPVQGILLAFHALSGWRYALFVKGALPLFAMLAGVGAAMLATQHNRTHPHCNHPQPARRLPAYVIGVGAALLPIGITWLLIRLLFSSTIFDFVPAWNDELFYWHQTLTFQEVGFEGGHYTRHEQPAPLPFFRFYVHGPMFPMLYGSIGALVGWHFYTAILLNMALLAAAILFFFHALRGKMSLWQQVLALLLLLSFWPILLYVPSNMQESLHHAAAIVLAGLFYRLACSTSPTLRFEKLALLVLLIAAALTRLSWVFLFFPLLLLWPTKRTPQRVALLLAAASALLLVTYVVRAAWSAPYPNFMTKFTHELAHAPGHAAEMFFTHALDNLGNFPTGALLEIVQRHSVLFVLAGACTLGLLALRQSWRDRGMSSLHNPRETLIPLLHLFNLGVPFALSILVYDLYIWRDYRVLAPHLLLSLLLFIPQRGTAWIVGAIMTVNLVFSPTFVHTYAEIHTEHFTDIEPLPLSAEEIRSIVVYEKSQNPWCNSFLIGNADIVLARVVPAGIGISYVVDEDMVELPLKSKYVFLEPEVSNLDEDTQLYPAGTSSSPAIFLNLDAPCPY
jgi:hypothetical protein